LLRMDASDGTCKWNQAPDELKLLNTVGGRQGVGATDILVFYANRIKQNDGSTLNGCAGHEPGKPRTEDPKRCAAHQIEHRNRPPLPSIGPPTQLVEDETETANNEADRDHAYQDGRDLTKVRGLLRYVMHRSLFPPPNGSRLSCGRNARRRKVVDRQIKRLASEAAQFFLACERTPASSAC